MAEEFKPFTGKLDEAPAGFKPFSGKLDGEKDGVLRRAGDAGLALAKGVIGVPEAAVGLADLATGGNVGKFLENEGGAMGFRPKQAKEFLDTLKSDDQQAADRAVSEAKGFLPTIGAMAQNPSTIWNPVIESAPAMLGGGVVSRGVLAAAPRVGAVAAGAIGEGAVAAGQNAEQVRQEDPNGLLTPEQSAVLGASGVATGFLGFGAGKLANRLGIGDVNTMLATGKVGTVGADAAATGAQKGLIRKVGEGIAVEGALQELPQSAQEQAAQNIAQGKPLTEGVAEAAAQGLLVGGFMGAGGAALGTFGEKPAAALAPAPDAAPAPTGPFTKALGIGYTPSTVTVGPDGVAQTADQRRAEMEARGGIIETSSARPSAPLSQALGLPAPSIAVTPDGFASTVEQRQAARDIDGVDTSIAVQRGGIRERMRQRAAELAPESNYDLTQRLAPVDVAPSLAYDESPEPEPDRAIYDQVFGPRDNVTDVQSRDPAAPRPEPIQIDDNIPWDEPGNADDMTFLKAMGYNEQEASDAIAETTRAAQANRAGAAETQGDATGAAQQGAGDAPSGAGAAGSTEAVAPTVPGQAAAPARSDLVEHQTKDGRTLRGVVRKDMTLAEARTIDPYALMKQGGAFIREAHLDKLAARDADVKASAVPAAAPPPAAAPAVPAVTANTEPAAAPAPAKKPTFADAKAKRAAALAEANADEEKARTAKAPAPAPAPAAPKPITPAQRSIDRAARSGVETETQKYYSPGNVVRTYGGGFDEVIAYEKTADGIKVTVHEVKRDKDGNWVRQGKSHDIRMHSTFPSGAELKRGPADRVKPGDAQYSEPRADGKPAPNAPKREAPAPLYSMRKVDAPTAKAITDWAKAQGFKSVSNDMHVTLAYSREPVDARSVPVASNPMNVAPSGRGITQFDGGAVVLTLPTKGLTEQWQALKDAGASWDYPTFQPHITISYNADGVDLKKVKPYRGPIALMGEERSVLDPDFKPTETPTADAAPEPQADPQEQRQATAAAERKRRAAGDAARARAWADNPARAFIAKHGIRLDLAGEWAPGVTERRQAMVAGYPPIFRGNGMSLDMLAQAAVEEGFLLEPDVPALEDIIDKAIRKVRVIPQYAEGVGEADMEARIAREREFEEDAADAIAAMNLPEDLDADIPWNRDGDDTSTIEFLRAMGASEQEIQDAIAEEATRSQERDASRSGDVQSAADAPAGGSADGGGLESPTPEQVVAQQERAQAGERSDAAKRRADAQRAQADADRAEFTLTGSDRATDANADQGTLLSIDEATDLPLNPDGTVTVYHHTSAEKAAKIRATGRLQAAAEPDVYVTTRTETDTGYGDTAVAIRVKPEKLSIDDEFPNGRRDFRLSVGKPGGFIAVQLDPTEAQLSFAGARSATADRSAMTYAQDRVAAGEDPEAVRKETGWHMGADGRWRYEISDADATLRVDPEAVAEWVDNIGGLTLGDVMDHPRLFAAYPQLADIEIDMKAGNGATLATATVAGVEQTPTIIMGREIKGEKFLNVLLHETQHAIQNIEKFASGGNPADLAAGLPDAQALNDARVLQAIVARGTSMENAPAEFLNMLKRDPVPEARVLARENTPYQLGALDARERYRRLAGEVEARNTQTRQKLSDAARRGFSPESTSDVRGQDVIVMMNGREVSNAMRPANALDAENFSPNATSTSVATTPANDSRQAKTRRLKSNMQAQFDDLTLDFEAVEPADVGGIEGQMLAATRTTAARLFGHDVVFVKFKPGTTTLFNGAVNRDIPGTVFIRVDATRPHMAIVGHELLHQLSTTNPELYKEFNSRLGSLMKGEARGKYLERITAAYAMHGKKPPAGWAEELDADIVGDFFMDSQFWQDMAAQPGKPGLFKLVVQAVLKFLDRLKRLMTSDMRPFGTEQYLADIDAARAAVVQAMSQFSADQMANPAMNTKSAPRRALWGPSGPLSVADAEPIQLSIDATAPQWAAKGKQVFTDYVKAPGTLSWWHKTIGSPYNLAQRNPAFKRVFDGIQSFLGDVSKFANDASQLAPRLIPRLETLADIKKQPLSVEDNKVLSNAVFEGTLNYSRDERNQPILMKDLLAQHDKMDVQAKQQMLLRKAKVTEGELKSWQALPIASYEGAVRNRFEQAFQQPGIAWTDAELESRYGMSKEQVGLFREYRAALDKSLDDLSVSEMLRYAGRDADPIRQMVLDAEDSNAAAVLIRDHLNGLGELDAARSDVLMDAGNKAIEISDRVNDLKARGYAPLSRFGKFTLEATTPDGERYFGMFESNRERMQMSRQLAGLGATDITMGTMNKEAFKLMRGMNPESAALFGEFLGLDQTGTTEGDVAYQTFLKKAVNGQSALRRMIHRKGIAGFNQDSVRGLADFITSNARRTSTNLHAGEISEAVNDVPKEEGETQAAAQKLASYVQEPKEEAGALRGLLFAQYLGGSIASALVNMTQPLQTTIPYLSQFGGAGKAARRVLAASKMAVKETTGDAELDRIMALNADVISPQEIHQLQGIARGVGSLQSGDGTAAGNAAAMTNNALSRIQLGWGKLFSTAEQYNRRITFIAAYKTALEQDIADPVAFARKTIAETQFVSNKGNRPEWARGAVGATLFTFKSYSVNYIEMLARMANNGPEGKKAAALALASLMLMGGAGGLPFEDDLADLLDGLMQRLGYAWDTKQKRQDFLASLFGEAGGRFVDKGISGIGDMPLDISGRMGMGNLIPGTGLLTKKVDYGRDVAELVGPAGDFAKRVFAGVGMAVDGNFSKAILSASPKAITNAAQGIDVASTGTYKDARGRKVIDAGIAEAITKGIGFQPSSVARVQEATFAQQNRIAQVRLEQTDISDLWAEGIATKDADKVKEAQDQLRQWNERNPNEPIRIRMQDLQRKAKTLGMSKEERISKTSPAAIRASVREQMGRDLRQ